MLGERFTSCYLTSEKVFDMTALKNAKRGFERSAVARQIWDKTFISDQPLSVIALKDVSTRQRSFITHNQT